MPTAVTDFDFCFKCFWTAEQTHPAHVFIKMPEGGDDPVRKPELEEESEEEVLKESSHESSEEAELSANSDSDG
jgi:hypothetical protein